MSQRFRSRPESIRAAREFVAESFSADGGAPAGLDDALLLVSEVTTNSVLHANTDFEVSVELADGSIRVEVRDGDPTSPDLAQTAADPLDRTSGRGLQIVERVAADWGYRLDDDGKTVWFSVSS